jgi:hypothetical protein
MRWKPLQQPSPPMAGPAGRPATEHRVRPVGVAGTPNRSFAEASAGTGPLDSEDDRYLSRTGATRWISS